MKINIFNKKIFKDKRGLIADIIYKKNINHVAYIYSKKDSIRGNHFHKKTSQYTFVVEGKIEYYYKKQNRIKKTILKKGHLVLNKPNEIHTFKTISQNSLMIVFTLGIRGGKDYEKDTYRVNSIVKK